MAQLVIVQFMAIVILVGAVGGLLCMAGEAITNRIRRAVGKVRP